jgi:hypothetical protein
LKRFSANKMYYYGHVFFQKHVTHRDIVTGGVSGEYPKFEIVTRSKHNGQLRHAMPA